ncbi:hypothetical protein AB0P19_14195 [Microbacterium oleivorans]|uniref:hypothetical protein n=1 Tax=Microbacterium TaxID=33882 RepID=UPI0033E5BE38
MGELDDIIRERKTASAERERLEIHGHAWAIATPHGAYDGLLAEFVPRIPVSAGLPGYQLSAGRTTIHTEIERPRGLALLEKKDSPQQWRRRAYQAMLAERSGFARILEIGGDWEDPYFPFVYIGGRWHPAETVAGYGKSDAWQSEHSRQQAAQYFAEFVSHGTHTTTQR